jgi:hypothetical protein
MPRKRYLGGRQIETTRTRYTGGRVVTTGRERFTGQPDTPPPAEPHHGHGLSHILEQGLSDLGNAAIHAPAGLYYTGKGLATDPVGTIKAIGESTVEDLRHPLRHPGYTLLDVLGLAGGAAGAVARVGEVGRALEAGASTGDVLRAATHRPVVGPRTLKRGGLEVKVGSSQSALGAAGQRIADRALHHAAAKTPGGRADRHLVKKIGKAVEAEAHTIQDVHKAPAAALIAIGKKLSPAEQKALQVVAEEAPLEGRITATSARVTGARNPDTRARHQAELDLLHQAKSLVDDSGGKPVFTGEHAAKLNTVLSRMRGVAASREELLHALGQLTNDSIASRKTNAGRVALGATYEKPTPAKLGVASRVLKREQARIVSLERRHQDALDKEEVALEQRRAGIARLTATKPGTVTIRKSMTDEEAQARLDDLDRQYETLLAKFAPEVNPYSAADIAAETRSRNTMRGRMAKGKKPATGRAIEGRIGGGTSKIKTVSQEVRDLAEAKLHQILDKHPDNPVVERARHLVGERDQLRELVNARAEAAFANEARPALPTHEHVVEQAEVPVQVGGRSIALDSPHRERIVTLAHALEALRPRLAAMEARAAARVKPTGILGADHFTASPERSGSPTSQRKRRRRSAGREVSAPPAASATCARPARRRTSSPVRCASRGCAAKTQPGSSARQAWRPHATPVCATCTTSSATRPRRSRPRRRHRRPPRRAQAERAHAARGQPFLDNPDEFFAKASPQESAPSSSRSGRGSSSTRPSSTRTRPPSSSGSTRKARSGSCRADARRPREAARRCRRNKAGQDRRRDQQRVPVRDPLPEARLRDPEPARQRRPERAAAGLRVAPEPRPRRAAEPRPRPRARRPHRHLMGEGFARAISAHGQGKLSGVVDKAASVWSKGVDTPFRRASFLYEARRGRLQDPGELERLLTDRRARGDLVEITQRRTVRSSTTRTSPDRA